MQTKTPLCRLCDGEGHYAFQCPKKAKRPLISTKKLKQNGKHNYEWQKTKRKWYKKNHSDSYTCHICGKHLTREETTLDHIKSRGRAPELRYEPSNIAPACWPCNQNKGSLDLEQYQAKLAESSKL